MSKSALRICYALRLATMLALILASGACLYAAAAQSDASSEDQMRQPWTRDAAGFITEWLVCGEFPNLPADPAQDGPDAPRAGLETDFLQEHGGEADIRPAPGMRHARPDDTAAEWTPYTSPSDILDFTKVFPNRPTEFTVGYAYTTVTPAQPGTAALAVGSDDGVRVWLNGRLVHDHAIRRGVRPDEDLVPVALEAGENRILVKVEQGTGGWGVCLRVLHPSEALAVFSRMLTPTIVSDEPGRLVIATNQHLAGLAGPEHVVAVEVVGAGGRIAASKTVPNGDRVFLDPSSWADGSYEIICSMTAPDARLLVRRLPWYKGDPAAAAGEVVASAVRADATTIVGAHHAMLADMLLNNAGGDLDEVLPSQLSRLYGPLMEFEELLLEQAGQTGGVRSRGFVRLAYFDEVDDSPQFCRAYLPAGYTPDRKWSLIVNLHGYYAENPPYVGWWDIDRRYDGAADQGIAIVIHPMGRYNTSYRGIGDADVLRCIELAKRRFAVDENRVYLTGYSMGGGGTWHVGTRHPDLFAALGPYYGGWDYHVWIDREGIANMTERARFLAEAESSFAQADQLLNVPVWVMHGDADTLVEPDQSRYVVRMLQRWGYDIRYHEVPGRGHEALGTEDALYSWFLQHERDPNPRHVRVRSADLEGAAAYWVKIGQREDPFAFINADVEVVGPNTIRLDTDNALEVTLSPGGALVDRAQPLDVIWNGADVRTVRLDPEGEVTLRADHYQPSGVVKTPRIEGPVADLQTTPFAVVIGTSSPDPMMRRLCRKYAESAAGDWQRRQHTTPRVFADSEITDEDMRKYSLILFGGPDENIATKKLIGDLPLRISSDEIVVDGRAFPAPDAALKMVYPNPLNPERYVSVIAATSPKGMCFADHLPDSLDFCIGDGRIPDGEAGRPEEKLFVVSGSFGHAWRLDPDYTIVGDPKLRAESPIQGAPTLLSAAAGGERLMLSTLLETKAEGTFAAMRRNLNWDGKPISLGGETYTSGIAVNTTDVPNWAEFDTSGGEWKRLRAVIGIEYTPDEDAPQLFRDTTNVSFIVAGDGKELYRSEPFRYGSEPRELDVDVTGVVKLRLEVAIAGPPWDAVASADWADLRLER